MTMRYDFDEIVDRRHTDCLKYEMMRQQTGRDDLLPLWVADMDFRTPPFILRTISERLQQGILGYPLNPRVTTAASSAGSGAAMVSAWRPRPYTTCRASCRDWPLP